MRTIRTVSTVGVVLMVVVILRGMVAGDLSAEGSELLGMPWGLTSVVDVCWRRTAGRAGKAVTA